MSKTKTKKKRINKAKILREQFEKVGLEKLSYKDASAFFEKTHKEKITQAQFYQIRGALRAFIPDTGPTPVKTKPSHKTVSNGLSPVLVALADIKVASDQLKRYVSDATAQELIMRATT